MGGLIIMAKVTSDLPVAPTLNFISLGDLIHDTKYKEFYIVAQTAECTFNIVNLETGNRFSSSKSSLSELVTWLNERHPDRFIKCSATLTLSNE